MDIDLVIAPLLLRLVGGVSEEHNCVFTAKDERLEERKEGFLSLTHGDGGPRVPGAAEEGWVVLLEEVVAFFPREEAGCFPPKFQR